METDCQKGQSFGSQMAIEIQPKADIHIHATEGGSRLLDTPSSLRVVLPRNKIQELKEFSQPTSNVGKELLSAIDGLHSLKRNRDLLPCEDYEGIKTDQLRIIQELRAMAAAREAIITLEEGKEVIIAPWKAENVSTIVKAPFYYMTLNDYGTQFFLELIFQESIEESLRQRITRTLSNNKKVLLSRSF